MHLHQGPDQEALYHYGEMLKQRKKKKAQLPMGFEPTSSRFWNAGAPTAVLQQPLPKLSCISCMKALANVDVNVDVAHKIT